jgi:hypothetical protein
MRYTTEYNPALTKECKTYIRNNIGATLESDDSGVYSLDYVYEELSSEIDQNGGEEIFGISLADIELLNKLHEEKVNYIEF